MYLEKIMSIIHLIEKNAARLVLKTPISIIKKINGKPTKIDGLTLDPLLQFMLKYFNDPVGELPPITEQRADTDLKGSWFGHQPHSSVKTSRISFQGPNGLIPCKVYRPKNLTITTAPVMLFFHGGGHVCGSIKSHNAVCHQFAYAAQCVVIAVDYRLAPEHKFPIGIYDCLAAYDVTVEQANELGIDPKRITLCGDSAGANIAAVIAQQRKHAECPPKFQMLWVPWVDMSQQSASYHSMGEGFFLEKIKMEWYTNHYLRDDADKSNPLASPIFGDVTGVCPAALFIAGFDPLRDEGLAYGEKLKQAGVKTQVIFNENLVHIMINVAGALPRANKVFDNAVQILRDNM